MSAINGTRVRVVPWANSAEFKKVYEHFYSKEINKKKWAYDTVCIWKTRCHPSLPAAIEATQVLTNAVITDCCNNEEYAVLFPNLQGLYADALSRFLYLIVELNRNRETLDFSIAQVAKLIGIPLLIVEVTEAWCYSTRPSLSHFRFATERALEYLKDSYWTKKVASVNDLVKQPLDDTSLRSLFQEFIKFSPYRRYEMFLSDDGRIRKVPKPEFFRLRFKLEEYLKKNKRLFVEVLVSDGFFIPTDGDIRIIANNENYSLISTDHLDDELEAFEREYYQDEVMEYYELLWGPVIGLLNKYDSVPFFMESLLRTQGSRSPLGQELLIAWILKILRTHNPKTRESEKAPVLKKIFCNKGIVPSWYRMLYSAIENPCKYCFIVLPFILEHLKIKQSVVDRISNIIKIKLGLVETEDQRTNFSKFFYTVEELKEALEHQRNDGERQSNETIGFQCPNDCHKSWPIGHIVNQVKDKVDVEEKIRSAFKSCSEEADFVETCNESEDEDQECNMDDEIDLNAIKRELKKRASVLYRKKKRRRVLYQKNCNYK